MGAAFWDGPQDKLGWPLERRAGLRNGKSQSEDDDGLAVVEMQGGHVTLLRMWCH